MDEKELQEFSLEDIIKEFGGTSMEEEQVEEWENSAEAAEEAEEEAAEEAEEEALLSDTRRVDPLPTENTENEVVGDTVRLDTLRGDTVRLDEFQNNLDWQEEEAVSEDADVRPWNREDAVRNEAYSEQWEPDYEQPIGEYVPPQPIVFHPRSRLQELKRKLVAGPEKRFYQLSEKGVGKLQAAIFLSLLVVLISAASTVMYALGMVQENRLRLMVFGQFVTLLVSALLGSFQMIEGVADLIKGRFTLNTTLVFTFLVCCVDGMLCLKQLRVPCCAAFSLEVTMSLWSAYQRRSTEISRMDTMRHATYLDGVAACPDYLDGEKGFLRVEGQVEDFMDHYAATGKPERWLNIYGLIATCAAFIIGIVAGVLKAKTGDDFAGIAVGVQVTAVSLLAAVPASAFICQSRPTWVLETKLHKLKTVLCGWQGVEGLSGKAVFPITFDDLYPADAIRLNGMKFFGSWEPDLVVAYAAAVISADESGLTGLFTHILDSRNGRHYDAYDLYHYDNGGMGGIVEDHTVLLGSMAFMRELGVEIPENARLPYGVYVAIEGELSALFAVSYDKTSSAAAGLSIANSCRKLRSVLISDDFMLTQSFLRSKFDMKFKRLLLPDYDVREALRQMEVEEDTPSLLMTTGRGLAPIAYGIAGARVLRSTCRMGMVLHIIGGVVGMGIMALLVILGALELLTPANMFLFQLVWMIPALLISEWTRSI